MSKAALIRKYAAEGQSPRVIAEWVFGLQPDASSRRNDRMFAYIRVVLRQRGVGPYYASRADRKWLENNRDKRAAQNARAYAKQRAKAAHIVGRAA